MSPKQSDPMEASPISVGDISLQRPQFYVLPTDNSGKPIQYPEGSYVNGPAVVPLLPVLPAENSHGEQGDDSATRCPATRVPVTVLTDKVQTVSMMPNHVQDPESHQHIVNPTGAAREIRNEWLPCKEELIVSSARFVQADCPSISSKRFSEHLQPGPSQHSSLTSQLFSHYFSSKPLPHNDDRNNNDTGAMAHSSVSRQHPSLANSTMTRPATSGSSQNNARRRSRAIAIKRKGSDDTDSDQDNLGYAAECEWATWRMYNRIVDHRQKHPVGSDYDSASTTLSDRSTASQYARGVGENYTFPVMQNSRVRFSDDQLEGEVFDLEL